MLDHFQDQLAHVIGPQFVGFATASVGVLTMAGALWRSRVVPRGTPSLCLPAWSRSSSVPGPVLNLLQAAQVLTLTVLGWFLWWDDSAAGARAEDERPHHG